jgi:hypothetical protein
MFQLLGYISGVAARLKKINPFMSSNHCVSHRLHLAGKDASEEVRYFERYENTLKNLYGYFSKSYKRQKLLKMMQVTIVIIFTIIYSYNFFY